jgi:hypothetical protein
VGALDGKIRVYLNDASSGAPNLQSARLVQLGSSDLLVPNGRSCPLVWDIDGDGKQDLLSGNTDGQICLYLNVGTAADPKFESMQYLQADGQAINIGAQRSRMCLADMNGDGLQDILSGGADGLVRCYLQKPAALPVFQFKECGVKDGMCYMEIIGTQGISVSIDVASGMEEPVRWQPLFTTNCPASSLTLTQEITSNSQRFYRVRRLP